MCEGKVCIYIHIKKITKCLKFPCLVIAILHMVRQTSLCQAGQLCLEQDDIRTHVACNLRYSEGEVHSCTGTEALYRPYGP